MIFPPQFLDEIRARVPVSEVAATRVKLQRHGHEYVGLSPFKAERTPSFTINDQKMFYHCFATGEHGDIFSFLMKSEGLSFPEAVAQLATRAGLSLPTASPQARAEEKARSSLLETMETAGRLFSATLRDAAGAAARAYLTQRGISQDMIARFRLGYAPAEETAVTALRRKLLDTGADMATLIAVGLYRASDSERSPWPFFRNRLLFPITDQRGRVIAFGGRFLGNAAAAKVGKYINSPATPLFDKGRTLYNYGAARRAAQGGQPLVAVEGYLDVISLTQAGFEATVAPLGTALTNLQLQALWRLDPAPLFCFDGDDAGRRAALKAALLALPASTAAQTARIVTLPDGYDPDSLVHERGAAALTALVQDAAPLHQFLWQQEWMRTPLDTPEQRAGLQQRLTELADRIADPAVRGYYRRAFSERLWSTFRTAARPRRAREGGRVSGSWRQNTAAPMGPPVGAALRAQGRTLNRRWQQAILAALINHPALLPDYAESLNQVAFVPDLDKIRMELQVLSDGTELLDSAAVTRHFARRGGFDLPTLVCDPSVYRIAWQASCEAPEAETRRMIETILQAQEHEQVARDLRRVESGAPLTEGEEARLFALRRDYDDKARFPDEM